VFHDLFATIKLAIKGLRFHRQPPLRPLTALRKSVECCLRAG
jgi:hypothetical protein